MLFVNKKPETSHFFSNQSSVGKTVRIFKSKRDKRGLKGRIIFDSAQLIVVQYENWRESFTHADLLDEGVRLELLESGANEQDGNNKGNGVVPGTEEKGYGIGLCGEPAPGRDISAQ